MDFAAPTSAPTARVPCPLCAAMAAEIDAVTCDTGVRRRAAAIVTYNGNNAERQRIYRERERNVSLSRSRKVVDPTGRGIITAQGRQFRSATA
jgi:hypothetical protein